MSEQYFVDKELYDNLSANYSRAELEIERLNNIIDELEKLLKQELDTIRNDEFFCNFTNEDYIEFILDKLNELKGDNK